MFNNPILFQPLYQERVWGARNLEAALGRSLPPGQTVGESWEIVDRPEAQSRLADGSSIRELIESNAAAVMGKDYDPARPFPILVKWLDCADRLSLQVHPPAAIAPSLGGEPKTENWYIADCQPDASLIVGLKRGATREEFEKRLEDQTLEACIHRFKVAKGQSILVESGRIHAIDAGNLILEIQQNSDTTYRVYDWGRVGLDGQPRQLHVKQSLACIDWNDFEPTAMKTDGDRVVLADCPEFRLTKHTLKAGGPALELPAGEARLLSVVEGVAQTGVGNVSLKYGDNALLPAASAFSVAAVGGDAAVLVTDRFI